MYLSNLTLRKCAGVLCQYSAATRPILDRSIVLKAIPPKYEILSFVHIVIK
jgi:hypothetical protein